MTSNEVGNDFLLVFIPMTDLRFFDKNEVEIDDFLLRLLEFMVLEADKKVDLFAIGILDGVRTFVLNVAVFLTGSVADVIELGLFKILFYIIINIIKINMMIFF